MKLQVNRTQSSDPPPPLPHFPSVIAVARCSPSLSLSAWYVADGTMACCAAVLLYCTRFVSWLPFSQPNKRE